MRNNNLLLGFVKRSMSTTSKRATTTLRIGILKCDTFIDPVRNKHGDIDKQFQRLLALPHRNNNKQDHHSRDPSSDSDSVVSVETHTFECASPHRQVPDDDATLDQFDGFIITGSRCGVMDKQHQAWIEPLKETVRKLDRKQKKVLGVCFGHQLVAEALGGQVEKNPMGWELAHSEIKLNPDFKPPSYWKKQNAADKNNKRSIRVLQLHADHVNRAPKDFEVIASTPLSANQAMIKGEHILTFQAHPEFTPDLLRSILEHRRGVIPDALLDAALKSLLELPSASDHTDQEFLAQLILDFFSSPTKHQQQ